MSKKKDLKFLLLTFILLIVVVLVPAFLDEPTSFLNQSKITARPIPTPTPSTKITFAGDLMVDRLVYYRYKNQGLEKIFENFPPNFFKTSDIAVVNLEGPISSEDIVDDVSPDNLIFNFPKQTPGLLKFLGVTHVSLANNHTLNDSFSGLERTQNILTDSGVSFFGNPSRLDDTSSIQVNTSTPVSFIGINLLSNMDMNEVSSLIKKEKNEGRFVSIFVHWGSEYQTKHSAHQEALAHQLVEFGADAVIGSHPHVVQDSEIYKNKLIVYSLGNFVFDQLFSIETQTGCIVSLEIEKKSIKAKFIPISIKNIKVTLLEGEDRSKVLERIIPSHGFSKRLGDDIILISN